MRKHNKYDLSQELYELGLIKEFRDIFNHLRKTPIAKRLGREKGRFNELIEDPDGFTMHELMLLSKLWDLSLYIIGQLIETQCPLLAQSDPSENPKYRVAGRRIREERITTLNEVFAIIDFEVAKELGRKPETIKRYLEHVEKFQVKDLRILAALCEVTLAEMFKLVEAQYTIQMNKRN